MKKGLFKNIFGDLATTIGGGVLGMPTITEGIELLPIDKTQGILKIIIGVGTVILGLLSKAKAN
jgi:hypothetical protein